MTATSVAPPGSQAAPPTHPARGRARACCCSRSASRVAAYIAVGLAHSKRVPSEILPYAGGLAAMVAAAHLAVRKLAPYADPLLLPCAALLNGLGLVLIHRLDLAARDRVGRTPGPTPPSSSPGP